MRITLALLILCIVTISSAISQTSSGFCGTESSSKFISELEGQKAQIQAFKRQPTRSPSDFPVTLHVIRKSDSTGGIDIYQLMNAIDDLNLFLANGGVRLQLCDSIQFIDDDQFYEFYKPDESSLYYSTHVPNTLNLYIANSITYASGRTRCGYAYFPGWRDMVMLDQSCALDGSTLAHEIGHFFGLYHTHGNIVGGTDELNDLSNCYVAGDDVCDTAADPMLLYTVDSATCVYEGSEMDSNGEPYSPDPSNFMSYAPVHCKVSFSEGQYDRMAYVAHYMRDYLGCPDLTGSFDLETISDGCEGATTALLSYTGVGGQDFEWDIDDDDVPDYYGESVEHTFTASGEHEVCLSTTGGGRTIQNCKKVQILEVVESPLEINFDVAINFSIVNPDMDHGWDTRYLSPLEGVALVMDNFHYPEPGAEDYVELGAVDLSGFASAQLIYKLAYAPYSSTRYDGLRIEISNDCGATYTEIYYAEGLELASVADYSNSEWMPSSPEDWSARADDISAYAGDTVLLRVTNINGHGNYLYLDDIEVVGSIPLAITFMDLDVIPDKDDNHLIIWETANEEGLEKYYVEASRDGLKFSPIGMIRPEFGRFNSYHHTAYNPKSSYYRIKALYEDGSHDYSELRHVQSEEEEKGALYPNPATNRVYLETTPSNRNSSVILYDPSGGKVNVQLTGGPDDEIKSLNIAELQEGLYTVVCGSFVSRFFKIK